MITVVDGAVMAARRVGSYAVQKSAFVRQRGRLRHLKWLRKIDEKRRITLEIVVIPRPREALLIPSLGYSDDEKIGIARCDWDSELDAPLRKIDLISNLMAVMAGASFAIRDFERDHFLGRAARLLERVGLMTAEVPSPEFRINQDASIDRLSERLISTLDRAYTLLADSCQTTETLLASLQDDELGRRLCLTHDQRIRATAACMVSLGASEQDISEQFLFWRDRFRREKSDVELGWLENFETVFFDKYFPPS